MRGGLSDGAMRHGAVDPAAAFRDARGLGARLVWGTGPGLLRALRATLWPVSLVYAFGASVRAWTYGVGLRRAARLSAPVISVGNLTVGGTGKTPMAAWLAERLAEWGRRPAILSRGYKSGGPGEDNDEARMLREGAPALIQVVDPDRARGGRRATEEFGADSLILDDGFQRLDVRRDLDIVLVDALCPFGAGRVFPAGPLREPKGALGRADVVVITRTDVASREATAALVSTARRLAPRAAIVKSGVAPQGLAPLREGETRPVAWLAGKRVFGFCGLGNPLGFFSSMARLRPAWLGGVALEDHASYPPDRVRKLAAEAATSEAYCVVTTRKDAVKVRGAWPGPAPAFALIAQMELLEGKEVLLSLVRRALKGDARRI